MDYAKILDILKANQNKNFIQRILNPDVSPKLDLGDGNYATHKMAWTTVGDKPIVFPTVVQDQKGNLKELPIQDAVKHALNSGEFIPFSKPEEADQFSQEYKKAWNPAPSSNQAQTTYPSLIDVINGYK